MGYFFQKAKEKNLVINEYHFRYKGPIPQSKETAILMLADGCEAALRAMNINATDKEALETISNIIYSRQKDGQLDNSNLSKGEIFLIKRAFLNVWKRIRHRRIQYPTSKNNTFSWFFVYSLILLLCFGLHQYRRANVLNNVVKRVKPPIPKMSWRVMSLITE